MLSTLNLKLILFMIVYTCIVMYVETIPIIFQYKDSLILFVVLHIDIFRTMVVYDNYLFNVVRWDILM